MKAVKLYELQADRLTLGQLSEELARLRHAADKPSGSPAMKRRYAARAAVYAIALSVRQEQESRTHICPQCGKNPVQSAIAGQWCWPCLQAADAARRPRRD
jgi:hypothetical protein